MKTLRFLFHLLFAVTNVMAVVLWVVSAYSDHFSPETSLVFSYLGLSFPVLCLLNLCFLLHWLFLGKWRFLSISLCALLICAGPVMRYFPIHFKQSVKREEVLKVLTYNVMAFGYKDHTGKSPNPILRYIAESDADIVCLQEFVVAKSAKNLTASKVYKALRKYPYRSVLYHHSSKYQNTGIAVFSKYPIARSRKVAYESDFNGSSVHEITIKGKKLTLINNHLESFKLTMEDRSHYASFVKSLNPDGLEDLRGAFEQKLGPAFRIRAKQAEAIAREVQAAKGEYVLVCGDFNDTPISYAHHTIKGDLKDAFEQVGCGAGITYNQNFFWFRIDHILHSSNMTAVQCQVDKVDYSDHYPLWCYLRLD